MAYEYTVTFAGQIVSLVSGLGIAGFIWLVLYFGYKSFVIVFAKAEILEAYRVTKLNQELQKRKIDMQTMMQEYKEILALASDKRKKISAKGTLDRIDSEVLGEIVDEPKKSKGE